MTAFDDPTAVVATIAEFVQPDGADFELLSMNPGERSIELRLVLDGVECVDCILPRDYLEKLSLQRLEGRFPEIEHVSIVDPRDDPAFAAAAGGH